MSSLQRKMPKSTFFVFLTIFGLVSLVAAGCSSQKELPTKKTYPAEGQLLYKGEPVRFATLELDPVDPATGAHADASTDEDGRFKLRTFSNTDADGAVPGEYTVSVDPGAAKPAGYDPKEGPQFTEVPPEARKTTVTITDGDNVLQIVLPEK